MSELTELQVFTVPDWTPAMVRSAVLSADCGDLTYVSDLVEAMTLDDRIFGVLQTRTLAMLGEPLIFEGESETVNALKGDGSRSGDWWKMFPESELQKFTSWAIMLGLALAERVYVKDEQTGRIVPRFKVWHPRNLRWDRYSKSWQLDTEQGRIKITPGDGQWVLYTIGSGSRPWADGVFRALYTAWIVKAYCVRDWPRHNEVLGTPGRIGHSPPGATKSDENKFTTDLKNLGRDIAMVLPDGWSVDLMEAKAQNWKTFQDAIAWADAAIEIALVAQVVTTEGAAGFSSGAVHEKTQRKLVVFTAESLSTALHDQALKPWTVDNFGNEVPVPWVTWDLSPQEDQQAKAKTIADLGDAITKMDNALTPSGQRVDGSAIAQQFGISTVELPTIKEQAPSVTLTPNDIARIVTVNEGRASAGLGPMLLADGSEDPDGHISIEAYREKVAAKHEAAVQAAPLPSLQGAA